jgi:hypothetical protein
MKIFRKALPFLTLFINFIYGATDQNTQETVASPLLSLKRFQETALKTIKTTRMTYNFNVDIKPLLLIKSVDLFNELASADDLYLFFVFYSYGISRDLCMKPADIFSIARIRRNDVRDFFDDIKDNYKKLLYQKLLKDNDQDAISKAMELYFTRFQPIWRKLIKPGTSSFDTLDQTFFFIQTEAGRNIYDLMESEFSQFFNAFRKGDSKPRDLHGERFRLLVYSLSNDESENFGLKWIANHENPSLIAFYFYFWHNSRHFPPSPNRNMVTGTAYSNLRFISNYEVTLLGKEVVFLRNFKSPYSPVISDEELKDILGKVMKALFDTDWPKSYKF